MWRASLRAGVAHSSQRCAGASGARRGLGGNFGDYPDLEADDISACLEFAAAREDHATLERHEE